jgi:hypothetical protein
MCPVSIRKTRSFRSDLSCKILSHKLKVSSSSLIPICLIILLHFLKKCHFGYFCSTSIPMSSISVLFSYLSSCLSNYLFLSGFPTTILYIFSVAGMRTVFSANLILNLITLIIFEVHESIRGYAYSFSLTIDGIGMFYFFCPLDD